jgi:hypothetical protein
VSKSRASSFSGISCAATTDCVATGSYSSSTGNVTKTLAEHWNGTTWSIQATPNPSGTTTASLYGVSCPSGAGCTAVGSYASPAVTGQMLAEGSSPQ